MVSEKEMKEIQSLRPEEQVVVLSLVRSFRAAKEHGNEAQKKLLESRNKHLGKNPMTMDEIDQIIHGED